MTAQERQQAKRVATNKARRDVDRYLRLLDASRGTPGRRVFKEQLEERLTTTVADLATRDRAAEPLRYLELVQTRIDLERKLAVYATVDEMEEATANFIKSAATYSRAKGISYEAWRAMGVPADVLEQAEVAR